ncbi:MAG: sortase B protein-sorting domain-containing protein [Elusimicrobia bacterium]|nr:sortase B protein-sorting domain-containing protein [Elusimicrobiota bacterium]
MCNEKKYAAIYGCITLYSVLFAGSGLLLTRNIVKYM